MIVMFVNVLKLLLLGLLLTAAGAFLTWHSFKMHYAGVVATLHVILTLFGLPLEDLCDQVIDRLAYSDERDLVTEAYRLLKDIA